ncbi:hypothetical protein [Caldalkalibacillus salinus]|uniref:hypothetical protein n=1 Tax=Caldalkalibacillus salinus TaxID=2803787 RepID=UPI00192353AA|nr:hypothetical protein [Caldalkalibacillus salinus]
MLVLASCGGEQVHTNQSHSGHSGEQNEDELKVEETRVEVTQGDFIYRLVTEKAAYKEGENINLYAELEYVGDQDEVVISHAASPFYFPMYEKTRGYQIGYSMPQPLVTTTLTKDEPLRERYKGSGSYGPEDDSEYIAFMKRIMEQDFPPGFYIVNGSAQFNVKDDEPGEEDKKYRIEGDIQFKVTRE